MLELSQKFIEIQSELKTLNGEQNMIAQAVYSYENHTHQDLKKDLSTISHNLQSCTQKIVTLHKDFPLIKSLKHVKLYIEQLYSLELKRELIQIAVDRLKLLLGNDSYANAIQLYKKMIRTCQGIDEEIPNRELEVNTACRPIIEAIGKLEKPTDVQILRVHREMTEWHTYACLPPSPKKVEYPDSNDQNTELGELLRNDLRLCDGRFVSWLTKQKNGAVLPCIESMEKIAYELQKRQEMIHTCLEGRYREGMDFVKNNEILYISKIIIQNLSQQLQQIRQKLYELMSTRQIREALHYASRLSAFIEEIETTLSHFCINTNMDKQTVINALQSSFQLISVLCTPNCPLLNKIESLYLTASKMALTDNLSFQETFDGRIVRNLNALLAKYAKNIVQDIEEEKKIWRAIVSGVYVQCGEPDEWEDLASRLAVYIEKEAVKWLFFPEKKSNIRLDMAVYSLKVDRFAVALVDKIRTKSESFKLIYDGYEYTCNDELVALLCKLHIHLQACSSEIFFSHESIDDPHSECLSLITQIEKFDDPVANSEEVKQMLAKAEKRLEEDREPDASG